MVLSDLALLTESMEDLEWFQKYAKDICREHEGEMIAIKNKKVVAFGPSIKILLNKLKDKGIEESEVIIEKIPEKDEIIVL